MQTNQAADILHELLQVSDETIQVVSAINGYSLQTMHDILFAVSGYRTFDQLLEEY